MKCQICLKEHNRLKSKFCSKSCSDKDWRINNKERKSKLDRLYREKNKEKIREYHKKRWIKNKEEIKEYKHQYYLKNKISIREKHKQYRIKNTEKIDMKKKRYEQENREILNKKSLEFYYKDKDRKLKALARHNGRKYKKKDKCERCSSTNKLEFHHSDYTTNDGITLCKKCHTKEHRGVYYERKNSNKNNQE